MIRPVYAILALHLCACGAAQQQAVDTRMDGLQAELKTLNDAYRAQSRRVEEMRDRIALLEDRLESRQLARVPEHLPVVRLGPPPVVRQPVDQRPAVTITQGDLARLGGGPSVSSRPVARGGPRVRRPVPPPANAANAGNIGVVPMPRASAAAAQVPMPRGPAGPVEVYKRAGVLYKTNDLSGAERTFSDLVERFPKHEYADNALYYRGQCRYKGARWAAALKDFRGVVRRYPTGNKVPGALLMIGLTLNEMGRRSEGREPLARLVALFPETDAGREAGHMLKSNRR